MAEEKQYRIAFVVFGTSKKEYAYLCEDMNINVDDYVMIEGHKSAKKIARIEYFTEKSSPYPISEMKSIGSKAGDNIAQDAAKEEESNELKAITKLVSDHTYVRLLDSNPNLMGRDDEIELLIESLHKKRMKNTILIGEAGVGKTTIIEKFANIISDDYYVLEFNVTNCIAGTIWRGMLEERMDKVLKDVAAFNRKNYHHKAILFIDEIHMIYNAGDCQGAVTMSNILKPYLSSGQITIIGATTFKEFHDTISKDEALVRRLSPIYISALQVETVLTIMKKFCDDSVPEDLLQYIFTSCENIPGTHNPDISVEVLDRALAKREVREIEIDKDMIDHIIDVIKKTYVIM